MYEPPSFSARHDCQSPPAVFLPECTGVRRTSLDHRSNTTNRKLYPAIAEWPSGTSCARNLGSNKSEVLSRLQHDFDPEDFKR